jgi:hypothetical protein
MMGFLAGSPCARALTSPAIPGDRLILVLEGTGTAGGTITFTARKTTPVVFTGFEAPSGFKLTSDYQGEIYLISEPLAHDQIKLWERQHKTKLKIDSRLSIRNGQLVKNSSGNVRVALGLWHKTPTGVAVRLLDELGRPLHVGGTP